MKIRLVNLCLVSALAYWGHVHGTFSVSPSFSVCPHLSWRGTSKFYFKTTTSAVYIGGHTYSFLGCRTNQHCCRDSTNAMRNSFRTTKQVMIRPKHPLPTLVLQPLKVQRPVRLRCTSSVQESTNYVQNTSEKHPDFEKFVREKAATSGVNLNFVPAGDFLASAPSLSDDVSNSEEANLWGDANATKEPNPAPFEGRGAIKSLVFVCNDEPVLVIIR
jgi:hypothetical protein